MALYYILYLLLFIITYPTEAVLYSFVNVENYENAISVENLSNDTHFTWILYPPWKRYNDSEYFGIIGDDRIINESFLETSKLTASKNINLTFYTKVDHSRNEINLILFTYQRNAWNKIWEYTHNDSQWQLHQLSINTTDEDIRLRFVPISSSSDKIFIGIAIVNLTTQYVNPSSHRKSLSIPLILLIIFGCVFLVLFITIMVAFIYGLINKQYNRWIRKRLNRQKRRKKNVIRDESTILNSETNAV